MNKSTLPLGIKNLKALRDKGHLSFDHPVQRNGGQWSLLQQGLLVHSVLMGYPTPPCYFLKMKNDAGENIYAVIDGKQRLSSLFDFIDGKYALHSAVLPCRVDGFDFDLANMKFEDLADDLKDEILGCRLSIFCLEDCTDEEVDEIFTRLNNATPLSPIQKCRSVMSAELAGWAKEICKMDFFQHSIGLTVAQLRREADLEVLLQSMLLLDARHEGYEYTAISTKEVTRYCSYIRGKYNSDKRQMILQIVQYLGDAFKGQHKFLKKSNIPMIMVLAKIALEHGVEDQKFKVFLDAFASSSCDDYIANTGSGNVKRGKTEGRLKAIAADFEAYFGIDDVCILGGFWGRDSGENSELIGDSSSLVGDLPEDGVSGEAEIGDGESETESGEAEIESEEVEPDLEYAEILPYIDNIEESEESEHGEDTDDLEYADIVKYIDNVEASEEAENGKED